MAWNNRISYCEQLPLEETCFEADEEHEPYTKRDHVQLMIWNLPVIPATWVNGLTEFKGVTIIHNNHSYDVN